VVFSLFDTEHSCPTHRRKRRAGGEWPLEKDVKMNRDRIAGRWRQVRGIAAQLWGKLTANHAGIVAGRRQQTLGEIQAAYGITKDASEKQLAEWLANQHKVDPIHK
jgi:uncharacterized protein YjbJ (UPF0337 family)